MAVINIQAPKEFLFKGRESRDPGRGLKYTRRDRLYQQGFTAAVPSYDETKE